MAAEYTQPLESIGCQDLLNLEVVHCGWIRKRHLLSKLKLFKWPRCYVILHDGCLYYFGSETSASPAGKFSLYGYNAVYRASEFLQKDAPWAFKILHTYPEFKTYYFCASSEKEMKEWMKHIKQELLKANGKSASEYYSYRSDIAPMKSAAEADNQSMTYNDIETKIYDDMSSLTLPKNYDKHYAVKRTDDDTDDEELHLSGDQIEPSTPEHIKNRPPLPLPREGDRAPSPPPRIRPGDEKSKKKPVHTPSSNQSISNDTPQLPSRRKPVNLPVTTPQQAQVEKSSSDESDSEEEYDSETYWASVHCPDDVTSEAANEIIRNIAEDGVYLVRNGQCGKVLVVFADKMPRKYRIQSKGKQVSLTKNGPNFDTLPELLYHYYESFLPTADVKLKQPYQLHKKYKESLS
ncbi:hypothetical protein ScPMuIL_007009 [Solemya velum]